MPSTDEALFERFRARGDAQALGELFDRAAPALPMPCFCELAD
jgi:hypothetical protein